MTDLFRSVAIVRVGRGLRASERDDVATEEPLEVRVQGAPFAVIMRTPGADCELAAGFLYAERVLERPESLGTIGHCTDPDAEHPGNIVQVTLAGGVSAEVARRLAERRQVAMTSSCGLCGRRTIESLRAEAPAIPRAWQVPASLVAALPALVREQQPAFDRTGGLHAAGLFTHDGRLVQLAEDVGRHNAVDKIIGRQIMAEALPLGDHLLCVSGRTSYEIVQKAWLAGIPLVAAVSAPSSLAVDLAEAAGITLVGFVRGDRFNVYSHPERILDVAS